MSWLRTAVSKAVVAGGNSNLTRAVRDYAGTVVTNAGYTVFEGSRFLQGDRSMQSFRQTTKRLEEVSVSCNGAERVQLLRRWLVALKEVDRISAYADENDDKTDYDGTKGSPKRRPIVVYYYDPELEGGPRNFREVFLHSQALEGITLSMILKSPSEEEVLLLIELYRLCLKGGYEVQNRVVKNIQLLAKAFMRYHDEVLAKHEEPLQYAQGAITGLKLNSDLARIDAETISLKEKLKKSNAPLKILEDGRGKSGKDSGLPSAHDLEAEQNHIQLCVMMELLLLRKKALKGGDSREVHEEKVDKLKVLSESLVNSSSKAERRIADHKQQKEEALQFRMSKTSEINQAEKEMEEEIVGLEKQKDELEAALKKVNSSLAGARQRLQNAKEEREQFDEASNQILMHFKTKEDELSRSIVSFRVEADIVNTWISFLETTWTLQASCLEQSDMQVSCELDKCGEYFVNMVLHFLFAYEKDLQNSASSIRKVVEELGSCRRSGAAPSSYFEYEKPRKKIEGEYLDLEAKIVTTLSIVETMKKQFYISSEGVLRKDKEKVKELFDAIEKIQVEFESVERPVLEVESPTKAQTPREGDGDEIPVSKEAVSDKPGKNKKPKKESSKGKENNPKMDAQLTKLMKELGESDSEASPREIGEWEFDELEKDFPPMTVAAIQPTTTAAKFTTEPTKPDSSSSTGN